MNEDDYEVLDLDPEEPIRGDFYSDPSYWDEYYRDSEGTPDNYETWPGDEPATEFEAYGLYAGED